MSEEAVRTVVVGVVLIVIALSVLLLRWRAARGVRRLGHVDLAPGVYFFSSASCLECSQTRGALVGRMGEGGFTEFRWESDPDVFERLAIDAVPSVVVVDESGSARVWAGSEPDLSTVDP